VLPFSFLSAVALFYIISNLKLHVIAFFKKESAHIFQQLSKFNN